MATRTADTTPIQCDYTGFRACEGALYSLNTYGRSTPLICRCRFHMAAQDVWARSKTNATCPEWLADVTPKRLDDIHWLMLASPSHHWTKVAERDEADKAA